ncbi:MAG: flagellar basal body rod protein FlgB [Oscillospiraceae bacterium]
MFQNTSFRFLEQGLDMTWQKQRVINQNIANDSTPGYKAKTVEFKVLLDKKCKCKYHPYYDESGNLMDNSRPQMRLGMEVTTEPDTNQTLDGNNVDIEKEALALADAQIQHSMLTEKIVKEFEMIKTALSKT